MLRTRLWMGSLLALVAVGVLFGDGYLGPWFPTLFFAIIGLGVLATRELLSLQRPEDRAGKYSTIVGVLTVLAANWYNTVAAKFPEYLPQAPEPWYPVLIAATATVIAAFLIEMAKYRTPGHSVPRVANSILAVVYLGILPSFFVKLRWLSPDNAGLMLGLTILVPKFGDISAYFTGRAVGRIPFSPWLSPKKTWEGVLGGLLGAMVASVALWFLGNHLRGDIPSVFRHGFWEAVLFGLIVGVAGVLGDLAESLIKRDSQAKDASKSVPGFGGVLDVIDSVLFAGPVAYLWLSR